MLICMELPMPRGRPRLNGDRYPSGKLKHANGSGAPVDAQMKWQRGWRLAEREIVDRRWGSSIGQLLFFARLSASEAFTADRFTEALGRYDRLKGLPRRVPASPGYEVAYGHGEPSAEVLRDGDED